MNQPSSQRRVAVLMGGHGSERDVSLRTGAACADALRALGHVVTEVDATRDALRSLDPNEIDVAFLALHGDAGEDGRVQGFLEILGIPYTGSGVLASALAMDKIQSKRIFNHTGVTTPAWSIWNGDLEDPSRPRPPVVIKRSMEGSSVGVTIARTDNEVVAAAASVGRGALLCEELISGRECTVAVLDGTVLGVLEIVTRDGNYDYQTKYHRTDNEYRVLQADGSDAPVVRACSEQAARACAALGCRGMARVDVLVDERGAWVLEVNTLPGMTASSLVPKIARAMGWSFEELVARMLQSARLDDGELP